MKMIRLALALAVTSSVAFASEEQEKNIKDAVKALKEGIELVENGEIDAGAEEIRWGLELIDKAKQGSIDEHFSDEVGEYKGGDIAKNKAMGMSITERSYTKNGNSIRVTLTRKTADGGGGLMQGLGSIAQFGMMQGERVRIGGRTGSAMNQGRDKTINLSLEDSSLLAFASRDVSLEDLTEFADEFPVREINDAVSAK